MMISLTNLLLAINTIILVGGAIFYFKKNYVVLDTETFGAIQECIEEYNAMIEEREKEEIASQELAGGYGSFFRDCIDEYEEEGEEDCRKSRK